MSARSPGAAMDLAPRTGGSTVFVILLSTAAALGGFLFGFDTAIINGAVDALAKHFDLSELMKGLMVSSALLGSAVGAWFSGALANRIGRVPTMAVAALCFLLSALGSGAPFGLADFVAWRILGGLGVGAASMIAPAYIAEVSPAHLRGRLGSLQQLAIVIGIFVALLTSYAITEAAGGSASNAWLHEVVAWRWMFWSEAPAALLYGLAALMIPESPRYLVSVGREDRAEAVLRRIEGETAAERVREIRASLSTDHAPRFRDIFGGRFGLLPIVWVGLGLAALQQFVGINVIFYYSSALWHSVGFTESEALYITTITGVVNIVTTLVAIALVDRFGRRPLLLAGSVGMALTLGTLCYIFATTPLVNGAPQLQGGAGQAALVAANLYVFCFGFSWGPLVWVLLGEMFNNRVRAMALALGCAVNWIANFIVSTSFPEIMEFFGLGVAYGLYTAASALSFVFVYFLLRETKGVELEDM